MAKTIALNTHTSQEGATTLLGKIQSQLTDRILGIATVVIGSSSKAKIKTTNTIYPIINGALIAGVASAETVVSGTVLADMFNVYVLVYDTTNGLNALMGTEAASLAGVVFPTIPANTAVVGFVIVNPTGTGNFVGGTTEFDDATVVPNAVFFDALGFNPNTLSL